jgi:hypothetical protein
MPSDVDVGALGKWWHSVSGQHAAEEVRVTRIDPRINYTDRYALALAVSLRLVQMKK